MQGQLNALTDAATLLGVFIVGALIASMINIQVPLSIYQRLMRYLFTCRCFLRNNLIYITDRNTIRQHFLQN